MYVLARIRDVKMNFDYRGNFSTYSPELLGMTHPRYGDFSFGIFIVISSKLFAQRLVCQVNNDIERGVAACKQTCDYFTVCAGGSPSNKLFENGTLIRRRLWHASSQEGRTNVALQYLEAKLERIVTFT